MTNQTVKVVRKAVQDSGKIKLMFELHGKNFVNDLLAEEDGKIVLRYSSAIDLSKLVPVMDRIGVKNLFGTLDISDVCPDASFDSSYNTIIVPYDKDYVRKVTKKVVDWFNNGIQRLLFEYKKRGIGKWLKSTMEFEYTLNLEGGEDDADNQC